MEAQQESLLKFVQQLGQQQGWEIPAQLLAPPPPPYRRESTPVSMSMDVLLSLLILRLKPSDGLRAGFVDVSAIMPEMWLSAFVSMFLLQVLETPRAGEVLPKFPIFLHTLYIFICHSHPMSSLL